MDKSKKPSKTFGIVPLSNFVLRGFGFVHRSIAIFCRAVPNPNITIRNFFIAVRCVLLRPGDRGACAAGRARRAQARAPAHPLLHARARAGFQQALPQVRARGGRGAGYEPIGV